MVVCQYFLQGRCYFGQNCRNEHISDGNKGGRNNTNNSLYSVIWQISNGVALAEKGGQWPLTGFAPVKGGPGLPGWVDISPEEVRWTLYEAQKNGTVNQALNQINQWYKNAEKARNALKQPTQEMINVLDDILKGKKLETETTSSSIFSASTPDPKSSFRFDTAVSNIFGKTPSFNTSNGSIFGGSSNGFQKQSILGGQGGTSTGSDTSNIFSRVQSQQQSSQNIFSNSSATNQNIFFHNNSGGSFGQIFQNTSTPNQNVFQAQNAGNIFSGSSAFAASNPPVGNANIFGNAQNNLFQSEQGNVFQGSAVNPFKPETTNAATAVVKEVDTAIYSRIEDLTEEEVNAFTSTTFAFGKIPLKPPPQQYC